MKFYRCEMCGLILEEGQLEDTCPKCGAPREKFHELDPETTEKHVRSDFTNDLYAQLINFCEKLNKLADAGISDNLDPSCVKIFVRAKANSRLLEQLAKAEIASHIAKGKW
ncbi:MAG: rubredoxin-type Fe(Cys)4 protein [Erysipelotrichaceae bacterium]|nr:MAG: rubredoxin-type Fe(Cys)4 [Erysipelotrichaceae bacterium]TXT19030.1 MAG: rubredoxin-type Fe(Cys)4 protein [Erysipelotrichaceae bacterium]